MNITRCDNHPEVDAEVTVSIGLVTLGGRSSDLPDPSKKYRDLCPECRVLVLGDKEAVDENATTRVHGVQRPNRPSGNQPNPPG